MSYLDKYKLPQELAREAENLMSSGYHLNVPTEANNNRKKGRARWTEYVSVEDAFAEEKQSKAGDTHVIFTLVTKVLAGALDNLNVGAPYRMTLRVNFEALDRDESDGQRKMSMGSIRKLKQLLTAVGYDFQPGDDLTTALSEVFPEQGNGPGISQESPAVGLHLALSFVDNDDPAKTFNGKNAQEVEAIALGEGA